MFREWVRLRFAPIDFREHAARPRFIVATLRNSALAFAEERSLAKGEVREAGAVAEPS
jgi:hypothetical protein